MPELKDILGATVPEVDNTSQSDDTPNMLPNEQSVVTPPIIQPSDDEWDDPEDEDDWYYTSPQERKESKKRSHANYNKCGELLLQLDLYVTNINVLCSLTDHCQCSLTLTAIQSQKFKIHLVHLPLLSSITACQLVLSQQ